MTIAINAGVDGGFGAALTDGLYLRYGVRQLHEPLRAREHVREKVRAQPEAEHGQVEVVDHFAQAVNLLRRKELRLVCYHDVEFSCLFVTLPYVVLGVDYGGVTHETDTAFHNICAVAVVHTGFDEPDRHAELLVVELGYQRLGALGRAHGAVFEIELSHF